MISFIIYGLGISGLSTAKFLAKNFTNKNIIITDDDNNKLIDQNLINQAKSDMIILHPLPRNDEIGIEIDEMPQAKYFAQVNYGVYMRMALLTLMLL